VVASGGIVQPLAESYTAKFLKAGMQVRGERVLAFIGLGSVLSWVAYLLLAGPPPLQGFLAFPIVFAVAAFGLDVWLKSRMKKRLRMFNDQLEMALQLISGGLRAGLGLRQALVVVGQESPEPIRSEFLRVIGQTNVGLSIYDALDQLAKRMPCPEMVILSRSLRTQSQTGGNLVRLLEQLANTIKARRRIERKIKAISAEGIASGYVIGGLPVGVAIMLMVLMPDMRHSLISSTIGHYAIAGAIVLEGIGAFLISLILKMDI
jgi:tight adherence protein B